jgi:hypothetical protein
MIDEDRTSWDIPLTDEFVDRVRRGVRRRRLLRGAAAGGATLAVVAATVTTLLLIGSADPTRPVTPPAASASATVPELNGFRLTWLPDGVVPVPPDSVYTAAVTATGLRNDGAAPSAGEARASVTMRRFDRGVGIGMFVTVLRPEPHASVPAADPAETADRLVAWSTDRREPVRTLEVPAGHARVVANVGTETTTYEVVVLTPDHVVVTIEGNAAFSADEMESVARGLMH